MAHSLKELTEEALQLPPDQRVTLAESLLLTIDETQDRTVDEATIAELERRLDDIQTGKVKGIPADQVFQEIRKSLKRSA